MDIGECNSYLIVDLAKIKANVEKVRKHIGAGVEIMQVLKGNAYGMGLAAVGRFMAEECGIKIIATAQVVEAIKLLTSGVQTDVFVMGGVPYNNIPAVVAYGLQVPAYNAEFLSLLNKEAEKQGKTIKAHIKIDTGLNRIGVKPGQELEQLCQFLKNMSRIEIVGAYTHFTDAEIPDRSITLRQRDLFKQGLSRILSHDFQLTYIHICNSAAATWLSDSAVTHVRPAGLCLGFDPTESPYNILNLEEPFTWRARVTNVRTIEAGDSVGYNREFVARDRTKVATVSFGYGDGYYRALAYQGADVLIHGQRAPIIGICMDQTFIDVSHIPQVAMNDQVTILGQCGEEFISVFEWQKKMGQTYLAGIATISDRVKRIYIR